MIKSLLRLLFAWAISTCPNSIMAYDLEIDGIRYNLNVSNKTLTVAKKYSYEGYIKIPDEVEYNTQKLRVVGIEAEAFSDCSGLRSVSIGNNVESIGSRAFQKSGIQSVEIGNGVKVINMDAFSSCKSLKTVKMGEGVETISALAFAYSPLIGEITIPSSCKSIGLEAFKNCTGLKRIIFEDSSEILNFETSYFYDENVFSGAGVEYVYQGRNFKRKENNVICYMFGHNSIKEVCIGSKVSKVDDFIRCTSIEIVRSLIQNPQTIALFSNTTYASAKLIVPIGTKALYEASDDWGKFFNIVEEDMSGIRNITSNMPIVRKTKNGIHIEGIPIGETIVVFNLAGQEVQSLIANSSIITLPVMVKKNDVIIVKIGKSMYKI